jgi:hypothetical protein
MEPRIQNATPKTCSNVSLTGTGHPPDTPHLRMPTLSSMLAAAVNTPEKPGLPFNQSHHTQCDDFPLAYTLTYTRRRMIKLDPANVTATVAQSRIRALSRVIVVKRLPCGQCKSSSQAATLIYFLLALRAHPVRRLCDEGLQPGSRLHVARNLKSLAKDAKDAVTRITLQPTLPNMSTPCPITRKGTPLAYPQPSLGATADPLSMLLRTRLSPVPRVMIIPRCHCQKWSGSCNFIDCVAQPCLDHGRIIRSRLPDTSPMLYATISTDSSIHRILLSFVAVGTVPIGH